MKWFYTALAAIGLSLATWLVTSAVSASRELNALDCNPEEYGPADGTFLVVFLPSDNPCTNQRNHLEWTCGKRVVQAGAATLGAGFFGILAVARRRRVASNPVLPPTRVA